LDSQCSTPLRACITIQIIDPQPLYSVKLSKTPIKANLLAFGACGICSIAMHAADELEYILSEFFLSYNTVTLVSNFIAASKKFVVEYHDEGKLLIIIARASTVTKFIVLDWGIYS